jgi:hypothetical protein
MSLLLRIFTIIAFNAILLSNTSSLAAGSCEGLFSESITSLDPSIPFELLNGYTQSKTPMAKTMATFAVKNYEATVQEALTERGINFEIRAVEASGLDVKWNEFVILPQGSHPLNKLAQSLKQRLGASVTFNPITNMARKFDASFEVAANELQISQAAILDRMTSVDAHEVIHALLLAQRLGRIRFMQKAPVGIHVDSKSGIGPENGIYRHFFSFEELITYGYEVSYTAKQTIKFFNNQKAPEFATNLSKTGMKLKLLLEVSNNSIVAIQKAQELLQQKSFRITDENGEQVLILETQDKDFQMKVFIPKNQALTPEHYVEMELKKADALAKFITNYFAETSNVSAEALLQKLRAFRSAQRAFIESL